MANTVHRTRTCAFNAKGMEATTAAQQQATGIAQLHGLIP